MFRGSLGILDTMHYYVSNVGFTPTDEQEVALSLKKTNASNHTSLASLSLDANTLNSDFDAATRTYTASVGNDVTEVTVTAEVSSDYPTVSPDGGDAAASEGVEVSPDVGENTVTVTVTAEDGRTSENTVIVTIEVA